MMLRRPTWIADIKCVLFVQETYSTVRDIKICPSELKKNLRPRDWKLETKAQNKAITSHEEYWFGSEHPRAYAKLVFDVMLVVLCGKGTSSNPEYG